MDRGAWWATVQRVTKSRTQLSNCVCTSVEDWIPTLCEAYWTMHFRANSENKKQTRRASEEKRRKRGIMVIEKKVKEKQGYKLKKRE